MYPGAIYIFPRLVLFGISVLRERTLGSTADRTAQPCKIHQLTERIKDRWKRQMKNTDQAKSSAVIHPATDETVQPSETSIDYFEE